MHIILLVITQRVNCIIIKIIVRIFNDNFTAIIVAYSAIGYRVIIK